jgi:hypothetical protein
LCLMPDVKEVLTNVLISLTDNYRCTKVCNVICKGKRKWLF